MSRSRFDRSNIRKEIKDRDRLYKEMTDLSIRAMGPGIFGDDAKNENQILKVISSLEEIQVLREGLESPASDDIVDLGELEFTKAIIEERAQEFKEKARICLASYDASSRPMVLGHLKAMKKLYDVSYARVNDLFDQKAQALQADQKHRNRATRVPSEVTRRDFEKLESGLNGAIGNHIKNLTIDLNDGTLSTPGQHVRISGDHNVQTALKNAIQAVGLTIEEKVKGTTPIVIVRLTEPLNYAVLVKIRENFQREMRQIGKAMPNPQARAANFEMKRPAGIDAERHRLPPSDFDNNAKNRNYLHRIVVGFNMPPEFTAEINAGTESTPGEHLRFSAHPKAHYELTALKAALDETGISYEEKAKGTERMLIIRQMPHREPGFEAKFKQHYVVALKKIDSEAKATKAATQILKDIQVSQARISMLARELQSRNKLDLDSMTLTSRDEIEYFTEETLDELDVEKDNIIQLKERLEAELPLSNMPVDEQKVVLQHIQNRVESIVISAENMRFLIDTARDKRAIRDNTPLPSNDRTDHLGVSEQESDASAAEKIELLAEIKRIKGDIHNMVENLTNEIPKASFSKGLKTEKRNMLLSLSRTLYVSEKSSLTELREHADKFREELAKCKTDAVLRQGNMRKTCRTLIDNLSKDVESEQHVFKRPK